MKKWLVALLLSQAAFLVSENLAIAKDQIVLISRTRSGRNWYQYAMEKLTGKRVSYLMPSTVNSAWLKQKKLWCTHAAGLGPKFSPNTTKLILTLRNYKEIFARQTRGFDGKKRVEELLNPKLYREYVNFMRCFDEWGSPMRHLFYYEDMMDNPEKELLGILEFIDEPTTLLSSFMHNIDRHIKASIAKYDRVVKYSITKGKDNLYHTRNFPKEVLEKMDAMMREYAGPLFDEYLQRYEEKSHASDLM